MTWPPYALLSSLATLAGCLALVGPIILFRSGEIQGSLGELAWLSAGILIWILDIAAVLQGQWRTTALGHAALGPDPRPDGPGRPRRRLEMRPGPAELVLDERRWLDARRLLGGHGRLLVVPDGSRAAEPGNALILDGAGGGE